MKKIFLSSLCIAVVITVSAQVKKANPAVKAAPIAKGAPVINVLKNAADSASYAIGYRIAANLKSQGLDPLNLDLIQKGMRDVLQQKTSIIANEAMDACIGAYQQTRNAAKSEAPRKAGKEFLAKNGQRKEVVTLPTGLQYEIIKNGTSTDKPTLSSQVTCHYHGTTINGEVFDSSVDRKEPATFPLANVIKGWQDALQLMTVGSKWKLFIPADLAYGDQQKGDKILPGSTLIFEVELLSIK